MNIGKNIVALLMALVLMVSLFGCGTTMLKEEDFSKENNSEFSMFIELETGSSYTIVYHKETRVMYAISRGYYNCGTFTIMLNANGTPMLYESD